MKKLFSLLMLCFMITAQADKISDGICESDVEKVSLALIELKPTAQQLMNYLDIAEQTIQIRQDILVAGRPLPRVKSGFKSCLALVALSFLGFTISSEYAQYCMINYPSSNPGIILSRYEVENSMTDYALNREIKNRAVLIVWGSMLSIIASSIALISRFESENLEKKYADAVSIEYILQNHLNSEALDSANKLA